MSQKKRKTSKGMAALMENFRSAKNNGMPEMAEGWLTVTSFMEREKDFQLSFQEDL
jgi:hypothetical protein